MKKFPFTYFFHCFCIGIWIFLLLLDCSAQPQETKGRVVFFSASELQLMTQNGELLFLDCTDFNRLSKGHSIPPLGSSVQVIHHGTFVNNIQTKQEAKNLEYLVGRAELIDVEANALTLRSEGKGIRRVFLDKASIILTEAEASSLFDIELGQKVVILLKPQSESKNSCVLLYDETSFVLKNLMQDFGFVLSQGTVLEVEVDNMTKEGTLFVEKKSGAFGPVDFDIKTRWQLGARFTHPQDFVGEEVLILSHDGAMASMVLSQRAIHFWFKAFTFNL